MTSNHHPFRVVLPCAAACLLTVIASDAMAQTLGNLAREEAARRKVTTGGKVYTNESLEPAPPPAAAGVVTPAVPGSQASTPGASDNGEASSSASSDANAPGRKDEAYWRERLKTSREGKARAEAFAEALQSRINALSADFANRDDPAQRNTLAADRQKALDELARVKKEVQEYTKALADLQTDARREGVPAGWVR